MYRSWLLIFLILPLSIAAAGAEEEQARPTSSASLEIGIDSLERAFIRPRFRYGFPLSVTGLYLDVDYMQRLNSRLQGEIDFWVRVGSLTKVSELLDLELSLNHLCRHKTSTDYPRVLDINELLGRIWIRLPVLDLGIGGGTYLGGSESHTGIVTADLEWPRILSTEFFGRAQVKWVDLEQFLYEFELGFGLDTSLDFFVRYTRQYAYPETAYLGMRMNSQGSLGERVDNYRLRGSVVTGDDAHKVLGQHGFRLDLFTTDERRLILNLDGRLPLKRGRTFFSTFYPDDVGYRVGLDYEIRLRIDLRAYVYGLYNVRMPVDRDENFSSSLGLGMGLRNQSYFHKLERAFRYDVYVGQNFSRSFDMGVRLGLNSLGRAVKWGGNAGIEFDPDTTYGLLELFVELGQGVRFRPFVAFEYHDIPHVADTTRARILIGIDLFKWN